MKFYFHPEAEAEFNRSAEYYEQCQPGLGFEFVEEVYAAISRIVQYPDAWSALSKNSRRCLVNRFPYGVIYQVKSHNLRLIAVAHLNRRPAYWIKRLESNKAPRRSTDSRR